MTAWMLGLAAVVALPVALEVLHRWRSTRTLEHPLPDPDWARAAQRLGLRLLPGPAPSWAILEGRIREFGVRVESRAGETPEAPDTVALTVGLPGFPFRFGVRPRPPGASAATGASSAYLLMTGDPALDDVAEVQGEEAPTRALLHEANRTLLREQVVGEGRRIENGAATARLRYARAGERTLVETVESLVQLSERLRLRTRDVPTALRENAESDPVDGVRRLNLEALLCHSPGTAETEDLCRRLAKDVQEVAWTRLLAARGLGSDSAQWLELLAHSPGIDPKTRLAAFGDLRALISPGARVRLALELIEAASPHVRAAALRTLGELNEVGAFERVLLCAADADVVTAAAAAETLGIFADARAEPQLLALLGRPNDVLQIAALKALARVGTLAASGPLTQLATGGAATVSPRVWAAAEEALKSIQRRVGSAAGGRLSLAVVGDDRGGLSLARGAGDLSVAGDRTPDEALPAAVCARA
ncbi:MAG: hypothetical protein HZA54_17210, partial [Planctomycetes bacterium]|nr:hypothetical protein [Planctomycetota bacterium]